MAERLKIYACSGVGDAQQSGEYQYWLDGTDTLENTQAVNSLLIKINGGWIKATRYKNLSKAKRLEALNLVDLYVVCLDAAKKYANNPDMLHKAGLVIGAMSSEGLFSCDSLDMNERDEYLEYLEKVAEAGCATDGDIPENLAFLEWWKANVEDLNQNGFTEAERTSFRNAISGIGEVDSSIPTDPLEMIYKAGTYYIYTFFTDADLRKLPGEYRVKVETKRQYQRQVYNYNLSYCIKVCKSKAAVDELCKQQAEAELGMPMYKIIKKMIANKGVRINGVGELTAAVASIITAIISAILKIVLALIDQSAEAQSGSGTYQKPTAAAVKDAAADESDFPKNNTSFDIMAYAPYLAIGVAAYALLRD